MAKSEFEENKVIKNQNTFSWSGRRYGWFLFRIADILKKGYTEIEESR